MQINRLLENVYILLDKKTVIARELSEHFEVSKRTIYRDIEILSGGGIPVYTNKCKGGGIGLLDNFVLNKSILSNKEQIEHQRLFDQILLWIVSKTSRGGTVE
jgi:predicted DNA-binding transcriptional regulator YafY